MVICNRHIDPTFFQNYLLRFNGHYYITKVLVKELYKMLQSFYWS